MGKRLTAEEKLEIKRIEDNKPHVIKAKGEFTVLLDKEWFVLLGNFENTALFEQEMDVGLFNFLYDIGITGTWKNTDIVNLIYYFDIRRDDPGHTQQEIHQLLRKVGMETYLKIIEDFGVIALGIEEVKQQTAANPNRAARRTETAKKKKEMKKAS